MNEITISKEIFDHVNKSKSNNNWMPGIRKNRDQRKYDTESNIFKNIVQLFLGYLEKEEKKMTGPV